MNYSIEKCNVWHLEFEKRKSRSLLKDVGTQSKERHRVNNTLGNYGEAPGKEGLRSFYLRCILLSELFLDVNL